jgi:hypothetical protein
MLLCSAAVCRAGKANKGLNFTLRVLVRVKCWCTVCCRPLLGAQHVHVHINLPHCLLPSFCCRCWLACLSVPPSWDGWVTTEVDGGGRPLQLSSLSFLLAHFVADVLTVSLPLSVLFSSSPTCLACASPDTCICNASIEAALK